MSNKINEFVKQKFPRLGTNKAREIMRLLFELSKVGILPDAALSGVEPSNYADIKNHLLKLRYPQNFNSSPHKNFYLPKFNIDPSLEVKPKQINFGKFLPENIYYDTSSGSSYLLSKAKKLYPQANFKEIENLKTFQKNNKFTTASYNDRRKNLFIVEEKFDFFKPCPCTKGVKCCGYSIINTGFGCLYDCSYCFLQGYQNVGGIVLPSNIENFLEGNPHLINSPLFRLPRLGSGEFTDSLVFDDITEFSSAIVEHFKNTQSVFEFKTKSVNVENLLNCKPSDNIVVAWSLNTPEMITQNEHGAPLLAERLKAAQKITAHGFKTAFHFDPIIYYENWKEDYTQTVETIFKYSKPGNVEWISLGSLRMPKEIKTVIENRFPKTDILNAELLLDDFGKLRYNTPTRVGMYKHMYTLIKKISPQTVVYLCMEPVEVWREVFI